MTRPTAAALAAGALLAGLFAVVPPASASVTYPTGYRISAVTHSSVTVTLPAISNPDLKGYVLAASYDRTQVSVTNLRKASNASHRYERTSSKPSITITGMKYTTQQYYYRVGTTFTKHPGVIFWASSFSGPFGLRPSAVTNLAYHNGTNGMYLSWTAPSSTGVSAEQSRDSAFRSGLVTYTARSTTARFTPYRLTAGTRYYYRVRAMNYHTHSPASGTVAVSPKERESRLRVMSYNVLGAYLDGGKDSGLTYASWTKRVVSAAHLVAAAMPDVLTVQEGDTILGTKGAFPEGHTAYPGKDGLRSPVWTIPASGRTCNQRHYSQAPHWPYRQVDSLCDATNTVLKKTPSTGYARAVDGNIHHNGYGSYLIYNNKTMKPFHDGGYFLLDKSGTAAPRWAGWAAFTVKATGAKVLVVTPHTSPNLGASYDARRKTQVTNMITQAKAKAKALGITSIVYAGDYNSYVGRTGTPDETTPIMHANHLPDAIENAQLAKNTQYLSSNFYTRSPKKTSTGKPAYSCIDHIYVTPGIGVNYFAEALHLNSKGQFADAAIPSDHNPIYADLLLPY